MAHAVCKGSSAAMSTPWNSALSWRAAAFLFTQFKKTFLVSQRIDVDEASVALEVPKPISAILADVKHVDDVHRGTADV